MLYLRYAHENRAFPEKSNEHEKMGNWYKTQQQTSTFNRGSRGVIPPRTRTPTSPNRAPPNAHKKNPQCRPRLPLTPFPSLRRLLPLPPTTTTRGAPGPAPPPPPSPPTCSSSPPTTAARAACTASNAAATSSAGTPAPTDDDNDNPLLPSPSSSTTTTRTTRTCANCQPGRRRSTQQTGRGSARWTSP